MNVANNNYFYNPNDKLVVKVNRLPHWDQPSTWIFVTWHLVDSVPQKILDQIAEERTLWLESNPKPWTEQQERYYHQRFFAELDKWLDKGYGASYFKDPQIANLMKDIILKNNLKSHLVKAFVIMPNHIHLLCRHDSKTNLSALIKSWKGNSSYLINRKINRRGSLWQSDYWDRLIRNEYHLKKVEAYIAENPIKAGLTKGTYNYFNQK